MSTPLAETIRQHKKDAAECARQLAGDDTTAFFLMDLVAQERAAAKDPVNRHCAGVRIGADPRYDERGKDGIMAEWTEGAHPDPEQDTSRAEAWHRTHRNAIGLW